MTENTDDIKLRESRQKCLDILGKFYHILKKVDPYETAIQLANTIRSNFKNRSSDHVSQTFVYLFVIEASFYYNRPFYSTVPVLKYFNELIQLSIKLAESYHLYCIENKEIDLLVKGIEHRQLEPQLSCNVDDLLRSFYFFGDSHKFTEFNSYLQKNYSFSLKDWIKFIYLAVNASLGSDSLFLNIVDTQFLYPLSVVSCDENEIRKNFECLLENPGPHLIHQVPSIFIDRPLLKLPDNRYLIVHGDFLIRSTWRTPIKLGHESGLESFSKDLGKIFEDYIGLLLMEVFEEDKIFTEKKLIKLLPDNCNVCDYVVDLDDCYCFIECKAIKYSARLVTEPAIKNDNSTNKICKAITQIKETEDGLKNEFPDFKPNKYCFGLCVTLEEIHFANSLWYRNIFYTSLEGRPNPSLPIYAIGISTFEAIIKILKSKECSLKELLTSKSDDNYRKEGDWFQFLQSHYNEIMMKQNVATLDLSAKKFFNKK